MISSASPTNSILYVVGLDDGVVASGGSRLLPTSLQYGEIVKAITQFYLDPTNAAIPIRLCTRYIKRKAEGADAQELSKIESDLRKNASQMAKP